MTNSQRRQVAAGITALSSAGGSATTNQYRGVFQRSLVNERRVYAIHWPDEEIPHTSHLVRYHAPEGKPFDYIFDLMDYLIPDHAAGFARIIDSICSLTREVVPRDETDGAKEAADMVKETIEGITGWSTSLRGHLESIKNGIQFSEINWKRVGGDPVPYEILAQPMRYFGFKANSYGEGVLHYRRPGKLTKPPPGKFLMARFGFKGFPWGDGLKNYTHDAWDKAVLTMQDWLIKNERVSRPNPAVGYKEGEDEKASEEKALEISEALGAGEAIAYTLGSMEPRFLYQHAPGSSDLHIYQVLIASILRFLLAEVNTMDLKGDGSYASYQVSSQFSHQKTCLYGADLGTFVSNEIFRLITDLRLPGAPVPLYVLDMVSTEAAKVLLEAVRDALNFGFKVPISHLRRVWKIPETKPGDVLYYLDQVLRPSDTKPGAEKESVSGMNEALPQNISEMELNRE